MSNRLQVQYNISKEPSMKQRFLGTIFKQMREVTQDHVCFAPLCFVTGPQQI